MSAPTVTAEKHVFTNYQKFIIAVIAVLQFTVILDFMVISPLGALLLKELDIKPSKFGLVVSAYAFSAGISGLLAAGFADKFDRKKLLLFFYAGFLLGTLCCGLAPTFETLLASRIVTGIFGGVIGSVSLAIVTDLFPFNVRGRVMGFVQMAFAVAQVAGIPFGIYLANQFNWHAPFLLIVALGVPIGLVIARFVKPVDKHLETNNDRNAFRHLIKTVSIKPYQLAFFTTCLLSIGGFMLMPFTSAFVVDNLLISQDDLPKIFVITGLCSMVIMPMVGRVSDKVGKLRTFFIGTIIAAVMVIVYTNLPPIPLWQLVTVNAFLFVGIMSRMIPSQALMTAIPEMHDRGAFMGITSSLQQIAGGIASVIAGLIVSQQYEGAPLEHFDTLGYIVVGVMFVALVLMYYVNDLVRKKIAAQHVQPHTTHSTVAER